MRRILAVNFFLMCLLVSVSHAGWPINVTPKCEGVVVDSMTGKPIENVIVGAAYAQSYLIGGPGGPSSFVNSNIAITDKDGKFVIPHRLLWNFMSRYDNTTIHFIHPLYDTLNINYDNKHWGAFNQDIKLISLEDKYGKVNDESDSSSAIRFEGLIESMESGYYWKVLAERGKSIDLASKFGIWDKIAKHLFVGNQGWLIERYNKTKDTIRNNLGETTK